MNSQRFNLESEKKWGRFNWSAWSDPSPNFAELDPFRQSVVSIGSTTSIVEIYLGLWHNSHFRQCWKKNKRPPPCKLKNLERRSREYLLSAEVRLLFTIWIVLAIARRLLNRCRQFFAERNLLEKEYELQQNYA